MHSYFDNTLFDVISDFCNILNLFFSEGKEFLKFSKNSWTLNLNIIIYNLI